jgi:hypothetical protein
MRRFFAPFLFVELNGRVARFFAGRFFDTRGCGGGGGGNIDDDAFIDMSVEWSGITAATDSLARRPDPMPEGGPNGGSTAIALDVAFIPIDAAGAMETLGLRNA